MTFFYTLLGDSLMLSSFIWFAGYGGPGPIAGLRLGGKAKLRLFAEVFAITIALLYLFITMDGLLGWSEQPPWPGTPTPHRIAALAVLGTIGFVFTRRRARSLHEPLPDAESPHRDSHRDGNGNGESPPS